MIDHMGISVTSFDQAQAFYDQALAPLGAAMLYEVPLEYTDGVRVAGYGRDRPTFWISEGEKQSPATHVALVAENRAQVDAFHGAALAAGGTDNGGPGLRPHYHEHYYGAFVLDPDGNNIEAVCHAPE